jgi:integrase
VNTSRTTGEASVSSSGYTITCTVNFIPNSSWQQRRRPWPVGGGLGGRPGGRNAARATCGSWCAAWPAPPGVGAWEQVSPHSLRHSAITFALDAAPRCVTCGTTPATKILARLAGMTTLATAWTATTPTPSLPTWRDSVVGA